MRVHSRSRGAMDPGQGWPWRWVAMRDIYMGRKPPWTATLACSLLALLASCALPSDPNSGVGVAWTTQAMYGSAIFRVQVTASSG
jgi:hypothetical protein